MEQKARCETYGTIVERLKDIVQRCDRVAIWNPLAAGSTVRRLRQERRDLEGAFASLRDTLAHDITCLFQGTQTPDGKTQMGPALANLPRMTDLVGHLNYLSNLWMEAGAILDQKGAYSLAIVAIYISILSVIVTILPALL